MEPRSRPTGSQATPSSTTTPNASPPPSGTRANARRREVEHAGFVWLDLVQATDADFDALRERFKFDPLVLDTLRTNGRRPRVALYPNQEQLFVEVHIPLTDRDGVITTAEVSLFVGRQLLVTIHNGDIKPLRRLFASAATDESARIQLLERGPGYLLFRVLDAVLRQGLPSVYRLDEHIHQLERRLLEQPTTVSVNALALARSDALQLRSMTRPNLPVIAELRDLHIPFLRVDMDRYFGDCEQTAGRLRDLVEAQEARLAFLHTTLDTLLAERTIRAVQFVGILSTITIVFVALTALASLQGAVSISEQPLLFGILVLITALIAIGLVLVLRYRKFL
jgi:magnesium transporter